MTTRRNFIKKAAVGTAMMSFGGVLEGFSAKSYNNIVGANNKLRVGAIGVNSRGFALASNFAKQEGCEVNHVCDVDSRALQKCAAAIQKIAGNKVKTDKDLRKMLESKDLDAVVIATPDHWHAPAALLAMQAGKDVYLEKPCSHSPEEGEILVRGAQKYNRLLQMGNQRRSWPNVQEAIRELKNGIIGNVYYGKSWYTNNRPSIGIGKEVAVPDWLDWELWQGPAPRVAYKDNVVHYNWHWFWRWGTGEALNNGTHMVDILRWGMELDYPTMVSSVGGRYCYKDDWETPDTQMVNIEFGNNKCMTWEGRSCNGRGVEGSSVGAMFYGEKGSLLITGANAYTIYDLDDKVVKNVKSQIAIDPRNLMNPAEQLDALHIQNFFDGIRNGAPLNADILSGHKSTLLVQLGNIAQRAGHSINIDHQNGRILNDCEANKYWGRTYEKGWEMKL
ncbi:Gfo/Idh/MocA family oxidoreductase [Parabacteroides bouchesdurhonensis]|uniref:Gfo/Idh/MocA family oxidoreductase n=1 Tax=Parabacteroides bouchesdurhonensis TaxID=1936995 RepID=UPI000E47E607|nr:Gfo/Idh/MocA family oxidoreductase [Parabacteroides bouchesdurhonensis]RHJ91789.1 gfo/Idh/MocA family oxidoreductase [Bacteroides sp. AM07-16]